MTKKTAKKSKKKTKRKTRNHSKEIPLKFQNCDYELITHRTPITQDTMNQIEVLCREGWSSEEIRYFTGITHTQWNEYKRANLGFAKKLKYWRSQALKRVKKSLYQKAIGYRTIDEKQTILVDESGKHKITKVERYIRQHAPDSQAGIFILKNEEPLKYRDNVTLDVNNVSRLSNERIEQLFLKIKNKEREDEMEDTESSNE